MYFDGFGAAEQIDIEGGGSFRLRRAGSGPAVLLLHGHPQTHAMWHAVAPALARRFTVICPDLPGYGGSMPEVATDALAGTRHVMAARVLALLDALGIARASVVGHDRGGRVAHRLAIDAPARVERLGVLDIVPVPEPFERADMAFALATYRMFWFAQAHPKPESLQHGAPDHWFAGTLPGRDGQVAFHRDAVADYVSALGDVDRMGEINAAFRRATELDASEDRIARASRRHVACPTLVLWGASGGIGGWYDPVRLWQEEVEAPVRGQAVEAGHFLAEEQPALVASLLGDFLDEGQDVEGRDVSRRR